MNTTQEVKVLRILKNNPQSFREMINAKLVEHNVNLIMLSPAECIPGQLLTIIYKAIEHNNKQTGYLMFIISLFFIDGITMKEEEVSPATTTPTTMTSTAKGQLDIREIDFYDFLIC